MLEQLLTCLELRIDFPFDIVFLGLIDYAEAMEESMLES